MSYVDQSLTPGETVILRGVLHWWIYAGPAACLVAGFLGISSDGNLVPIGYGLIFAGLLFALRSWIAAKSTEVAITSKRVIAKTGLVSRSTVELSHTKVESLKVDQSIAGRLLGFGTLTLCGSGGTATPIANIAAPMEFRRRALEAIEAKLT